MGLSSDMLLTLIERQNEIIGNLFSIIELEKEKGDVKVKLVRENPTKEFDYNPELEKLERKIAVTFIKTRDIITAIENDKESLNSIK